MDDGTTGWGGAQTAAAVVAYDTVPPSVAGKRRGGTVGRRSPASDPGRGGSAPE
ncbi:hypothetical protein Kpho01_38140 [Kitasatospora phosalacinea]|uniref:Uncharacterized protein n=1 Tax=Kitasatospora phosalacinea TaxID=2065 RepID=A0A9W6PJ29_9ACTN|nr:hypothetical protein Kpho01_38140 [Kitasatospora phosalacinea]